MIKVIAVGSVKEEYIRKAISDYLDRINDRQKLEICVVEDEKCPEKLSEKEKEEVKRKEAVKIMKYIKQDDYVVALTIEGKEFEQKRFEKLLNKESVCFIIGGSLGLHDEMIKKAKEELSFGKMTYPHQLMRWILVEKINDVLNGR